MTSLMASCSDSNTRDVITRKEIVKDTDGGGENW
jgi:hypothetical protein